MFRLDAIISSSNTKKKAVRDNENQNYYYTNIHLFFIILPLIITQRLSQIIFET